MGRLRREALETMDQAQDRLDDAGELIDQLQVLAGIGLKILERLDRISAAIEKHGLDVNPKVADTEIPVGINISTTGE